MPPSRQRVLRRTRLGRSEAEDVAVHIFQKVIDPGAVEAVAPCGEEHRGVFDVLQEHAPVLLQGVARIPVGSVLLPLRPFPTLAGTLGER